MITTIIFDLDDTLYDEVDYCKSGFKAVAEFLANLPGLPSWQCIYDAFWKEFSAGNRKETFNRALNRLDIPCDDKLIRELVKIYRNHVPQIVLPVETKDILDYLKKRYVLALLTDGFLPAQQLKVQVLGIEKYFKCIIYTEQLGREFWKPSPVGFEKIMAKLNVRPLNIVYVADNQEKDFIAPNKLGFTTIQLIRPARLHTESSPDPNAAPRYVIHKISQLPDLV